MKERKQYLYIIILIIFFISFGLQQSLANTNQYNNNPDSVNYGTTDGDDGRPIINGSQQGSQDVKNFQDTSQLYSTPSGSAGGGSNGNPSSSAVGNSSTAQNGGSTVNPTGSNYTNNSTNSSLNSAGVANADKTFNRDAYGNYDVESIKAYQTLNGLNPDGKLGADTAAALNNDTPTGGGAPAGPEDTTESSFLGVTDAKLRAGDVDMDTIAIVIVSVIETLLGIAGTIAIFSLIYHAVQMQINSGITGDSTGVDNAKKGMIGSLIGFVIAISAWFIVTRAVDLLAYLN